MSILSGFIKTKRYRKQDDDNYQLQSEWTHSDTVEFDDGKTLTEKISSHNQTASTITSGTFGGSVVAKEDTDYTTAKVRNALITSKDPTDGASVSYPNGSLIFVYEETE